MISLTDSEKKILEAYANNNMSLGKTAKALFYHKNTVLYHLKCIREKYGLNPNNFYDLCKLFGYVKAEDVTDINDGCKSEDIVYCKDCEYLMFSDCYGECSQAHKGIVSPDDSCGYGKRKDNNDEGT